MQGIHRQDIKHTSEAKDMIQRASDVLFPLQNTEKFQNKPAWKCNPSHNTNNHSLY